MAGFPSARGLQCITVWHSETLRVEVAVRRSELDLGTECADCGAPVLRGAEAGFGFGDNAVLCSTCATRRGGSYDAHQERWVRPPRVADLLDEPG